MQVSGNFISLCDYWRYKTNYSGISSAVLGPDNSIYFHHHDLYCFDQDGKLKLTIDFNYYSISNPAILADGTIYKVLPRAGTMRIKYIFNEESQSWTTDKGRAVKFTPKETKQLLSEVESLPLDLKTKLIEKLLNSLNPSTQSVDELWKEEI